MKSELLDFCLLQSRLLALIRDRIRAGEFTERFLARLSGVSQPHVHNVLKGVRDLTPQVADRFLHSLDLNVFDLIHFDELEYASLSRPSGIPGDHELAVLTERIGPGHPFSRRESRFERINIPLGCLIGIWKPIAVRLEYDPEMAGAFAPGDMAILDYRDELEPRLDPDSLYLVLEAGEARARWIRETPRGYYVITYRNRQSPVHWRRVPLDTLRIEARLHLAAGLRTRAVPRRPPGKAPEPARRSAAN